MKKNMAEMKCASKICPSGSATDKTRVLPAVLVPESDHVTQLVDDHAEDGAVRTEGDDLPPGTLPPHERTTPATRENTLFYNRF